MPNTDEPKGENGRLEEDAEDYRVQREDQGAPDDQDPEGQGKLGTARPAMKKLEKAPRDSRKG